MWRSSRGVTLTPSYHLTYQLNAVMFPLISSWSPSGVRGKDVGVALQAWLDKRAQRPQDARQSQVCKARCVDADSQACCTRRI